MVAAALGTVMRRLAPFTRSTGSPAGVGSRATNAQTPDADNYQPFDGRRPGRTGGLMDIC